MLAASRSKKVCCLFSLQDIESMVHTNLRLDPKMARFLKEPQKNIYSEHVMIHAFARRSGRMMIAFGNSASAMRSVICGWS
jgi:hypothetical protein